MNHSLLCETVTGSTMADLVAARDAATDPDLVELRLDGVAGVDVAQALQGRRRPAIVTCRPVWEGGRFDGGEDARQRVLSQALELGAEFVDVEWRSLRAAGGAGGFDGLLHAHHSRIVVSSHDFSGVSGDLCGQARAMRNTGAAVIKVAVTPARLSDTLPLLDVAREGNAVVIGMGDAGVATRLLATRFGSRWTYGGKGLAPGQVASARMLEEFRFRTIGDRTLVFGVVGSDVMRSLSPAIHNAALAAAGLDAVCVPLLASDFEDFLAFAETLGVVGASVATPFLRDALAVSVRSDEAARREGAANTLRRASDGWEATYTVARPVGLQPGSPPQDDIDALVAETERQFEWWTGRRPASGVMRAAALAETGHREAEARHGRRNTEADINGFLV